MRVIYVHQYFKTPEEGGAVRSYHLARGLVKAGIEVEMVTAHNEGQYHCKLIEGIRVHYLPVPYDNCYGSLKRGISFLRFVHQAKRLIKNLPRPDLFYISSTPLTVGMVGLWAKKKLGLPYIFEVRDLWPEAPVQVGVIKSFWMKKALFHLEEKIYHHAFKIVALSPGMKRYIVRKKPTADVILIPNFSDIDFFFPVKKNEALLKKFGISDSFTLAYTGAMGRVNALQGFLRLAKEAQNQSRDWQFLLMGRGQKKKELVRLAKELKLTNTRFFPFGEKAQVRELLSVTDMAYVSFASLPVLRTNSPNKFFDALAMGKAILTNHKGWVYQLIKENQLGFYHQQENNGQTIRELETFAAHPKLLQAAQERARDLAISCFSKEKAISKLLVTLDPVQYKTDTNDGVCSQTA